MRLLLSFAVTCCFLAGQTCGSGMGAFYPLKDIEGDLMSRMVVRCGMEKDAEVGEESADCGVGKCVSQGRQEQEPAATVQIDDAPAVPVSTVAIDRTTIAIAYIVEQPSSTLGGRPPTVVRRE